MTDVFTRRKRSEVMAAIRAKNTKPEVVVRRLLHMMGYRFRIHLASLPGKPDIVIPKIRTIVQVKGCFWHGHRCLKGRQPGANRSYWIPKIAGNVQRDRKNDRKLRALGWQVTTVWECEVRKSTATELHRKLAVLMETPSPRSLTESQLRGLNKALAATRNRRASSRHSSPPR
jgi:DNA mismatch endonuclease, patch repair protein